MSKKTDREQISNELLNDLSTYFLCDHKGVVTYVGIDPGAKNGCIAVTHDNMLPDVMIFDMICKDEKIGKKTYAFVDPVSLRDLLDNYVGRKHHVVFTIEQVHVMPNDSKTNAFNFGRNFGHILSSAYCHDYANDILIPSPIKWKKVMLGSNSQRENKVDRKALSIEVAKETFNGPYVEHFGQFHLKKSHNRAEAALLALYGKMVRNGEC